MELTVNITGGYFDEAMIYDYVRVGGWSGLSCSSGWLRELVYHSWIAVRTWALVILSDLDFEAAGVAVDVVLVVVFMSDATGGCCLMENSSRCNVTGKLWSCWQQSAAAVTY